MVQPDSIVLQSVRPGWLWEVKKTDSGGSEDRKERRKEYTPSKGSRNTGWKSSVHEKNPALSLAKEWVSWMEMADINSILDELGFGYQSKKSMIKGNQMPKRRLRAGEEFGLPFCPGRG